jgi:hypothetical protein
MPPVDRDGSESASRSRVSIDQQHVALPKLYGAPAYARPPRSAATLDRPFDPDDLPIEASMSEEDRAFAASLSARAWAPGGGPLDASGDSWAGDGDGVPRLHARPLSLRAIAGRLIKSD